MARTGESIEAAKRKGTIVWGFFVAQITQNFSVIISLIIRGAAVLAGFAVTYLIGHNFGAAATGQFGLITQTAIFFAVVGLMGFDVAVVRHFAKSIALQARIAVTSLLQVVGASLCLILGVALVLWLGGDFVWGWLFGDNVPYDLFPVLCLLLLGRAGARLFGALLSSQHRFALGQAIPALIIPLCTALALATGIVNDVRGALWAAAIGSLIALTIGAVATFSRAGSGERAIHISMKAMAASSLPLWGAGVAHNIAEWFGLAVAAQMLGVAEAGLYRASIQIAAVLQIASMALFSVYSAKISAAFHAGDRHEAAELAASAVRLSFVIAIPMGIMLIMVGGLVLSEIGPEFERAYPILVILVIGQVAVTLTGPCGLVLAMSGNEKSNLIITVASTTLLLVLVPIFAYYFGLAGLAICISLATLSRNIAAYLIVYHKEGIGIWTGSVRDVPGSLKTGA